MRIFGITRLLVLSLVFSIQAQAGTEIVSETECTAKYGEGFGEYLVLKIQKEVQCYRCDKPKEVLAATISVPLGHRGTKISQKYAFEKWFFWVVPWAAFKKSGLPLGSISEDVSNWFSEGISIASGAANPLENPKALFFRGRSLDLACK
jgi:hypothetical protein